MKPIKTSVVRFYPKDKTILKEWKNYISSNKDLSEQTVILGMIECFVHSRWLLTEPSKESGYITFDYEGKLKNKNHKQRRKNG